MCTGTNKIHVFVDNSGSTRNSRFYWDNVNKIIKDLDKNESYYFWNSSCKSTTKDEIINNSEGKGGTTISLVADHIVNNNLIHDKIIIISDGMVSQYEILQTANILSGIELETECYLINGTESSINLSIPLNFTRAKGSFTRVIVHNKEEQLLYSVSSDFNDFTDEKIKSFNLEESDLILDKLRGLIIGKNLGRSGNESLRTIVLKVKQHFNNLMTKNILFDPDSVRNDLLEEKFEDAEEKINSLIVDYYKDSRSSEDVKFAKLLNLCGNTVGMSSFDAVKFKTSSASIPQSQENIELVEEETGLECPISMDDIGQACIPIFDSEEYIFDNYNTSDIGDILAMPLNLLQHNTSPLLERIGYPVGELAANQLEIDPFTRRKILGYIPLGHTKNAIQVGNTTLNRLFSALGKQPGNFTLYLSAIYLALKRNRPEWFDERIIKLFASHLKYRFENTLYWISLSGLPDFLRIKSYMITSLYYVINYYKFNVKTNVPPPNPFHYLQDVMEHIFELSEDIGLKISDESRANLKWVLLHKEMKLRCESEDMALLIRSLYWGSLEIDLSKVNNECKFKKPCLIITDGPVRDTKHLFPEIMREYDRDTLLKVFNKFKPTQLDSKPYDRWSHLKNYKPHHIKISKKTMRPQYKYGDSTWLDEYQKTFGPYKEIFSGCKLIMLFFSIYFRLPNEEEFILFAFSRDHGSATYNQTLYGVYGSQGVVPENIRLMYQFLYPVYDEAIRDVPPDEVLRIYNNSISIQKRELMEKEELN